MKKLPEVKILDEKEKILHTKSKDIPLDKLPDEIGRIHDLLEYLEMSQIEETREYYDLRAGMGLSYIQIGIPYRIFVIAYEVEEGKFDRYVVVNPKIKSVSEELVYIVEG